jgi:hypothetical protein
MITTDSTRILTDFARTIHKHSKKAERSTIPAIHDEHRRRAWVLLKISTKFAQHLDEADLYHQLSNQISRTPKDRSRCATVSAQEMQEVMAALSEFNRTAAEFDAISAKAAITAS